MRNTDKKGYKISHSTKEGFRFFFAMMRDPTYDMMDMYRTYNEDIRSIVRICSFIFYCNYNTVEGD